MRKCENISNAKIRKFENGENDGKNSNAKIEDGNTEEGKSIATKRHKNHKKDDDACGTNTELTTRFAREHRGHKEKSKFKFGAEFMFWNKTEILQPLVLKTLASLSALSG